MTARSPQLGLQIATAKITTYGERAVDVFYVKDVFGHKVDEDAKLKRIREKLLPVLGEPESSTGDTPPPARRTAATAAAE